MFGWNDKGGPFSEVTTEADTREPLCDDPWHDSETRDWLEELEFWGDHVIITCIASIGILGNLITIVLFNKRDLRSTFHANLSVLAFFDLGYLTINLFNVILNIFDYIKNSSLHDGPPNDVWVALFPFFIWPFSNIFLTASMYMTVAISIDRYMYSVCFAKGIYLCSINHVLSRYVVICYPYYACRRESLFNNPRWPNRSTVDVKRVLGYAFAVGLFATAYCIPHFFEYEVQLSDEGYQTIFWTSLKKNSTYTLVYTIYIDLFVRYMLPVMSLIFTNGRYVKAIIFLHCNSVLLTALIWRRYFLLTFTREPRSAAKSSTCGKVVVALVVLIVLVES